MTDSSDTLESTTGLEAGSSDAVDSNFGLAIVAGLGAAAVGAIIWGMVVYLTQTELGIVAIALGALVGIAVRKAGRSSDTTFGIVGACCAALGWFFGMIFCDLAVLAQQTGQQLPVVMARLGVVGSVSLVFQATQAMDLLFLAIAVWEGYKFAIRKR